jgi:AraC family transcriptional regulator
MRNDAVPVTMGSPWFRSLATPSSLVTEARFSPRDVLHPHAHARPILAVMLEGSFDTAIGGDRFECLPDCAWTEPGEERHANYIGHAGARVLVIQPDPAAESFQEIGALIDDVVHVRDPMVGIEARRVLGELDVADRLSALAIDALIQGMLIRVARRGHPQRERHSPGWLSAVRERLHEEFATPPTLRELAIMVGVTPTHLCHSFRRHVGMTVGQFVRAARANWAAEQLRHTDRPLSAIAAAAGYSDQSHFIRECRRLLGVSPSAYRRGAQGLAEGTLRDACLTTKRH